MLAGLPGAIVPLTEDERQPNGGELAEDDPEDDAVDDALSLLPLHAASIALSNSMDAHIRPTAIFASDIREIASRRRHFSALPAANLGAD
jgi:hypothetical protein